MPIFFVCVERIIKEKQIILGGLINSSTHSARRMNIMLIAQLTFLRQKWGKELCFLLLQCPDSSLNEMARVKRQCQNLKCDIEKKGLESDKDLDMELNLLFFSVSVLK